MRPVLAARSARARSSGWRASSAALETAVADVSEPATVRALRRAGRRARHHRRPVRALRRAAAAAAAIDAGAHYLDSTGEPPFIRAVFERYGPAAERVGLRAADRVRLRLGAGQPRRRAGARREAGDAAVRVDIGYFITGGGPAP